jgi:radical SAM protein with 4Fe4S-binding SPASM domain
LAVTFPPARAGPAGVRRLVLQWHLTERCNYRCAHCYQESYAGEELGFDELLEVVEQYRELLDLWEKEHSPYPVEGQVTLTGGEPFLRPELPALLETLATDPRGFRVAILTNGSFIDEGTARWLAGLGVAFVQVSLEGSPERNDRIRGEGSHGRAVEALRHLVAAGVSTLVSFTASRSNFREFPEVARLGHELGVTRVWSDRLIPSGSGAALSEELLSPEETRELFGIMREVRSELQRSFTRTEISLGRALQFLVGGGTPYRCGAGERLITLEPDGSVLPCRRMPIRVGNVRESRLASIYRKDPLLQALRDPERVSEGCEDCRHARSCSGGLRCLSYALTGDPFRADPGCWHARPVERPGRSPKSPGPREREPSAPERLS